ncbi:MAG TPA: class I SAM-dependent methyltransferase [Chitinophagaceae bacterium]|nr:class I SAM-dependent methyltransferase [Chitinophagaceae bacterium]
MKFIKQYLSKTIAAQLRRPSGLLAHKVGNKMNKTNNFLYDFTVNTMQLSANEAILEIGFGNGKLFDKLFSAAPGITIAGLDFSPEMVKEATSHNQAAISDRLLTLTLGSSDRIPFPDKSFDKVFCINVIYFWEKPAAHLTEILRVLKPGGRFYASIRSKECLSRMPFSNYGFTMYTAEEWIHLLEKNSFHPVETRKTENEPDTELDGKFYKMASLCIVAEKK